MVTGPDGAHGVHVPSRVKLDLRAEAERVQTQLPSTVEQTVQDLVVVLVLVHCRCVQVSNLNNMY